MPRLQRTLLTVMLNALVEGLGHACPNSNIDLIRHHVNDQFMIADDTIENPFKHELQEIFSNAVEEKQERSKDHGEREANVFITLYITLLMACSVIACVLIIIFVYMCIASM